MFHATQISPFRKHHLDFDPQDIRLMGGLRKEMPISYAVLLTASSALAGLPFFSGYLSKDLILVEAWSSNNLIVPILLTVASLFTSFYIFRLIFKVFWGENRLAKLYPSLDVKVHESAKLMTVPMAVLAICSCFFIFSINPLHGTHAWIMEGLKMPVNPLKPSQQLVESAELWVPVGTVLLSMALIFLAYRAYVKGRISFLSEKNALYKLSFNAWYVDELYRFVIIKPVMSFAVIIKWLDINVVDGIVNGSATVVQAFSAVVDWIDRNIVDGTVNGLAAIAAQIGDFFRGFQTGRVQQYMALGVLGLILIVVLSFIF